MLLLLILQRRKKGRFIYPTCNDDPCNDRQESQVSNPSLPLAAHDVGEDGGEEGRGGPDGLVKRHRKVPQRHVPADDGEAEHDAEAGDLEELCAGLDGLHGHHLHAHNGNVAEQRAGGHVAEGEEDRVLEPVVAEQVLVEKQDTDVGAVPSGHHPDRRPWDLFLHDGAFSNSKVFDA